MTRHTIQDIDDLIAVAHKNRQEQAKKGLVDHRGRWVEPAVPDKEEDNKPPHTHPSYCMKCKKKVDSITDKVEPTERNSHRAIGKCPTCGTKTHTLMNNENGIKMIGEMATTGGQA
jgi:DNA-directed RNA polymerase subunit RPC12/RpoP